MIFCSFINLFVVLLLEFMGKEKNSTSTRGSLIKYALDDVKRESFDAIRKELKGILNKRSGIYALYKHGKVVKVGLSTGLYGRVKGHSKNKEWDWDTASFFVIKKVKYISDVETAVNRIAKPRYSIQKGRVGDEHYLERLLKKRVKRKQRELRDKKKTRTEQVEKLQREIKRIKEVIKD